MEGRFHASCTTNCLAPLMVCVKITTGLREFDVYDPYGNTWKQESSWCKNPKKTGEPEECVRKRYSIATTGKAKAVGLCHSISAGKLTGIFYRVLRLQMYPWLMWTVVLNTPTSQSELRQKIKGHRNLFERCVLEYVDDRSCFRDFVGDSPYIHADSRQTIYQSEWSFLQTDCILWQRIRLFQ